MAKTLYGEYGYTGTVQTVSLPAGLYLFELYGAQGKRGWFTSPRGTGGLGGGAIGIFRFSEQTIVNIYVGNGADLGAGRAGGYNGGGNGHQSSSYYGGGGGGATDIRIGGNTISDRVLVAAGGGGASYSGDNGELTTNVAKCRLAQENTPNRYHVTGIYPREPPYYRSDADACHDGLQKNTVNNMPHASGMRNKATVKDKISAVGYRQQASKPSSAHTCHQS